MNGNGENSHVILADTTSPGYSFAKAVYEGVSQKSKDFSFSGIEVQKFRDGEIKPRVLDNVRGKTCYFIHDSAKKPSDWFTELALVNGALAKSSARKIIDVFPYLRFSRQDRKDVSRVPISAAVVANVIDSSAQGVLTVDVHNPAIDGFYRTRFDNLHSFPTVVKHINPFIDSLENLVIMSPDAGGAARAQSFAKRLGVSKVAFGYKSRKNAGEVDSLEIAGDVDGKDVLIVDDIIDSGGTLIKASQVLRQRGAKKRYAYGTHPLFTNGLDELTASFDKIFVSDTVSHQSHPKIEAISLAPLFAEAIYRMSTGASLTELFE